MPQPRFPMISEHLSSWLGHPVKPLSFEELAEGRPDVSRIICRLYTHWDSKGSLTELFSEFLSLPGVERTPGVIIGAFSGDEPERTTAEAVELLVNAHARLPALRGIFLGDILSEENEISWINQSDVSPLFAAYPQLEHFAVRGGTALVLGRVKHARLKSLVIQTGGLPRTVLADLARCELPALEHLELWLGSDNYGWDGGVADLQPLLAPGRFPKLRYLGLCNSEIQDEVAALVAKSPILAQLETLDLSKGALTDKGAEALLAQDAVKRLKKIDLSHHFLSDDMMSHLRKALPHADLSDQQEADGDGDDAYRNIYASE